MTDLRANDPESWLETIWHALGCYREDCIPEGEKPYDSEWNEICTSMMWIREELGLPDEVEKGYFITSEPSIQQLELFGL